MKYISAPLAFGVSCSLNTVMECRYGKEAWKDENVQNCLRESDGSLLGNWGIEQNVYIMRQPLHTWNVANHLRAWLDMLYEQRYEELKGLFDSYIRMGVYRRDLFEIIISKYADLDFYKDINSFMYSEFGNAWVSFNDAVITQARKMKQIVAKHPEQIPPEDRMDAMKLLRGTERKV